jgi:hypothetical protein
MDSTIEAVKYRSGWAIVENYGTGNGTGRSGYWAEDLAGGWGVGRTAESALNNCGRVAMHRSRKRALAAVGRAQA